MPDDLAAAAHTSPPPRAAAWRRFAANRAAVAGGAFLALVLLAAVLGPWLSPHPPHAPGEAQVQPPNAAHWFGTDVHGRDVLSRVLAGARISFLVGFIGAGVSLVLGVGWGAVAGYLGGRWDGVMMRIVDVLYALPSLIFVIVLMATLEGTLQHWGGGSGRNLRLVLLFAGLGAISWLTMARIVRGQVLSLREQPFVEAARSLGLGHGRILFRHILPNVYGIILAYAALTVPSVILYESFLSFLGFGIQPPMASWGTLLADGAGHLNPIQIYWWLIFFPAATLVSTLLALNFFGDGLRDAFDPKAE